MQYIGWCNMAISVICHYITFITVVYMRSHCKCFQERELIYFCYLTLSFTSKGKWVCAIDFGARHLYDASVSLKLKNCFKKSFIFIAVFTVWLRCIELCKQVGKKMRDLIWYFYNIIVKRENTFAVCLISANH